MRSYRRVLALALSAALMSGLSAGAAAAGGSVTLGIYSTTDMHGKCYGLDPITGKEVDTSYLKVATAMAEQRKANDATILIDNGDVIQGSPIISYNMTMEGGRDNPMALCLRYIGYDAFVPGNHEFNFDQESQQLFYDLLEDDSGTYPGSPVAVLCANYIDTATQQPKMAPYTVLTVPVGGGEFRVGILGFENVNVPNWDLPSHYEGADFVHSDNKERSYAYEWVNYWQQELREEQQCDFVIVAAHSGEGGDAVGDGEDGAVGSTGEAFRPENQVAHLIANTTGIDLVISGHNHVPGTASYKNAEGKSVPVVNGGTSTLTRTMVTLRRDGSFTIGKSENLSLADYENDAGLEALMEPYYQRTLPFVEQEIGVLSGEWDDNTRLFLAQSDTMDLVHEAQLWATGADVSIASPVAAKDFCVSQLLDDSDSASISLKDCYSIYKYDNNQLYMVEMTGQQLKNWLEECVKDYTVAADGSISGGGFGTDQIYGISYDVYLGDPEGARIANMTYQGKPVTHVQTFKVAVNSYRLSASAAGDEYGWYETIGITPDSDEVLWEASASEEFGPLGGSCTLILAEYIRHLAAQGKEITPPEPRSRWTLNPGTSAEALAPVTRLAFVERLYEAAGRPTAYLDLEQTFSDLDGTNPAAAWAAQAGIVLGNGAGEFLPDTLVSREQAAVMLFRYDTARDAGPEGSWAVSVPYTDAANCSTWASQALMWNVIRGYLAPDGAGRFLPQSELTFSALEQAIGRLADP